MTSRAPLADPQRRLHAFLLDQAVVLLPGAGVAAWVAGVGGATPVAVLAGLTVALLGTALLGALAGATGTSPGRALCGVVLVAHDAAAATGDAHGTEGSVVGPARGALRALLLATVGWLSAGTGWVVLALGVARDADGGGRGWHDRLLGSRVVARRAPGDLATAASPTPGAEAAGAGLQAPVPLPRRPVARVLPQRWRVEVDGGEVHDVADRLRLGGAEFARMPDGALVLRATAPEGTLLVRGGAARTVPAGRVSTLLPDDRVRVGERWTRVVGRGRPVRLP